MSLTQYYTATTLDGFIADPNDSLEWLFTRDQDRSGPLNYGAFIAEVGALAMGSTTYEWVLEHEFADKEPAEWKWPYELPGWVFTHRELTVVPNAQVVFTSDGVGDSPRADGGGCRRKERVARRAVATSSGSSRMRGSSTR